MALHGSRANATPEESSQPGTREVEQEEGEFEASLRSYLKQHQKANFLKFSYTIVATHEKNCHDRNGFKGYSNNPNTD